MISNPKLQARLAGLMYAIVFIGGGLALYLGGDLVVPGDAAATAARIQGNEHLFRLAGAANLIAAAAYLGVTALLYEIFKPVNRSLSLLAAFFSVVGGASAAAAAVHHFAALNYLGEAGYLGAFTTEQLQTMARLSLRASGASSGLVFYGFYCASLGVLILQSRFLPRVLAVLLLITGAAWLTGSFTGYLAPGVSRSISTYVTATAAFGELAFTLWILIRGVDEAKWFEQARSATKER